MTEEMLARKLGEGESQKLEFKESFGSECIETACAFANANGGWILVGVRNDGTPNGMPLPIEAFRDFEQKISSATEPRLSVEVESVKWRGKEVVVIKVPEHPLKPLGVRGRCYIRRGSTNHQMTPSEIAECHLKSTGASMDSVAVPGAALSDLDMDSVRRYMTLANEAHRRDFNLSDDPWLVLKKLGFVRDEDSIPRAILLAFGKNPQKFFSQAVVHAGLFRGGANVIDGRVIGGSIISQIDEAVAFVRKNTRVRFVISGKTARDEYWDYPTEAIRETIANAVCHRDYGIAEEIQLRIFEDRLRVWSPGALPFDMTMSMLDDPYHESHPRNKLIAQILYDIKYIEKYGSGIGRIKNACADNGNEIPVWSEEANGFLTVYKSRPDVEGYLAGEINGEIKGGLSDENLSKIIENGGGRVAKISGEGIDGEIKYIAQGELTRSENAVRRIIAERPGCKRAQLMAALELSPRSLDRVLATLVSLGIIAYKGAKKTGGYYLVEVE